MVGMTEACWTRVGSSGMNVESWGMQLESARVCGPAALPWHAHFSREIRVLRGFSKGMPWTSTFILELPIPLSTSHLP